MISNQFLRDTSLSFRARGLGSWLLSHVDGWQVSAAAIAKQAGVGRDQVRSMMQELEDAGYLRRARERTEDGKLGGMLYEIQCTPFEPQEPDTPSSDQRLESQALDSSGLVSTPHKKTSSLEDHSEVDQKEPSGGADGASDTPRTLQASTMVAAYVDSFRAARDGQDPPKSVILQVGREAKRLLEGNTDPDLVLRAAQALGKTAFRSLETEVLRVMTPGGAGAHNGRQANPQTPGQMAAERKAEWQRLEREDPERFSTPVDPAELDAWLAAHDGAAF
jgi:DNA-binding Lrp family transcriptional regulator